jgi:phospholipase C
LQYRAAGLLFLLLIAGGGVVACSDSAPSNASLPVTQSQAAGKGSTPISHLVVIVQENRSFDDLFATFPNANGTTVGYAMPMTQKVQSFCSQPSIGQPVITQPTSVPLTEVTLLGKGFPPDDWDWNQDLAHNYPNGYLIDCDSASHQPNASNPCAMDGFDNSYTGPNGEGHPTCTYTYQYVNPKQIAPYWDMAQQYVLADDTFETQGSESFTAHQALIAGGTALTPHYSVIDDPSYWPWGCDAPTGVTTNLLTIDGVYFKSQGPFPCFSYSTVRDLLDAKKISWKYYSVMVNGGSAGIWDGFDAIKAVRYSKEWGTKVVWPNTKIFKNISNGTLPAVSWITPDGEDSDHPGEACKCDKGPSWVASIVNAIGNSAYWADTAVIVTWDDWGGWYDHVVPTVVDDGVSWGSGYVYGFRVPLIVVSPYAKASYISHVTHDFGSIVKFIETTFALPSLGYADGRADDLSDCFDLTQAPLTFHTVAAAFDADHFINDKHAPVAPDDD